MKKEEITLDILKSYFPDECEIAGSSNVEAISKGSMTFVHAEHGVNMPIMEIVTTLATIASFVASVIAIIEAWVKMRSNKPSVEEINKAVESSIKLPAEIDAHILNQIYSHILKKVQEEIESNTK